MLSSNCKFIVFDDNSNSNRRRQWHPLQYSCLENPMVGGAWWAAVHGSWRVGLDWGLHFSFSLSCIGEGNGDPLQCSCLKNPRDGGAWWAAVYGVAQSRTWLKRLSSSNRNNDDKKRQSSSVFVAVQKWCLGPGKCGPAAGELGDASSPSSPVLSPGCSHGSNFRGHCENRNQDCFVPWVLRPSLS